MIYKWQKKQPVPLCFSYCIYQGFGLKMLCLPVIFRFIIDGNKYMGLISEAEVLDRNNIDDAISTYNLNFKRPFGYQNQHLFEIISLLVQNDVEVLPIIDSNEQYLGLVTTNTVVKEFSKAVKEK